MDIFEELTSLLRCGYLLNSSYGEIDKFNKKLNVSFVGNSVIGVRTKRDIQINGEEDAKRLYELLFKGYAINKFCNNSKLSFGVSNGNEYGIEFIIDGKRLSKSELDTMFKDAVSNMVTEYNALLHDLRSLKSEATSVVHGFQIRNITIEENKAILKELAENNKKLIKTKELGFMVSQAPLDVGGEQIADFYKVLQSVKENNTIGSIEPEIVNAVNSILNGKFGDRVEWTNISTYTLDPLVLNDMITSIEILKAVKGKLVETMDEISKAAQKQELELEKIRKTINSIRNSSMLGLTSKEKVNTAISESEIEFESKIDRPVAEVSDDAKSYKNTPFISGYLDSFKYDANKNKTEIDRINNEQNEQLTHDEKLAVNLYKSQLYRAFNNLIRYMKSNNFNLNQIIINDETTKIIRDAYEELYAQATSKPRTLDDIKSSTPNKKLVADSFFSDNFNSGVPTFDQYQNLIIRYYAPLMSALSKVTLNEDMVVYRGVSSGELDMTGIISTTLDPTVAPSFQKRDVNSEQKAFIRIRLPKGSPVIMYTNNILENFPKQYDDNLKESQKELAFNSELYEVVNYTQTEEPVKSSNGTITNIIYFDVTLRPKVQVLQQEESGTTRS